MAAGLIGMRERVELLHGELAAGPMTESTSQAAAEATTGADEGPATGPGGNHLWEVRAVLPAPEETPERIQQQ